MIVFAMIAALQVSPGASAAGAGAVPAPASASAKDLDRVICRTEEQTGTRLGAHRVCLTKLEWNVQAHDAGDAAALVERKSFFYPKPTDGRPGG